MRIFRVFFLLPAFLLNASDSRVVPGIKRTHNQIRNHVAAGSVTPPSKQQRKYSTPATGTTDFTKEASLEDIVGISRASQYADNPQQSNCALLAPFFTSDRIKNDILENHRVGVTQTVVVGPSAALHECHGSSRVAQLVQAGVHVLVHPRLHTKAFARHYTDVYGDTHSARFTSTANPTGDRKKQTGCYKNIDSVFTVKQSHVPDEASRDFDQDITDTIAESVPYTSFLQDPACYTRSKVNSGPKQQLFTSPQRNKLYNAYTVNVAGKICDTIDNVTPYGHICACAYTLNDYTFIQSLVRARARGVPMTLYVDRKHVTQSLQHQLGDAIVPVAPTSGIQHEKTVICNKDGQDYTMYYGSKNHTYDSAEQANQVYVTKEASVAQKHEYKLRNIMQRYAHVHSGPYVTSHRRQPTFRGYNTSACHA